MAVKPIIQIYSRNINRINKQIKKLTTDKEIVNIVKRRDCIIIETETSIYRGQIFNQGLRGNRYTDVWIDKKANYNNEELEIITAKIIPPFTRGKLSEEEYRKKIENYQWEDHIYYFK